MILNIQHEATYYKKQNNPTSAIQHHRDSGIKKKSPVSWVNEIFFRWISLLQICFSLKSDHPCVNQFFFYRSIFIPTTTKTREESPTLAPPRNLYSVGLLHRDSPASSHVIPIFTITSFYSFSPLTAIIAVLFISHELTIRYCIFTCSQSPPSLLPTNPLLTLNSSTIQKLWKRFLKICWLNSSPKN